MPAWIPSDPGEWKMAATVMAGGIFCILSGLVTLSWGVFLTWEGIKWLMGK